jgi:hypothetical protein
MASVSPLPGKDLGNGFANSPAAAGDNGYLAF